MNNISATTKKDVKKLYLEARAERFEKSNLLRREFEKTFARLVVISQSFLGFQFYLETIYENLGEDAVKKASKVISLFDKPSRQYNLSHIALGLADVACHDPTSFDSAIAQITEKSKSSLKEAEDLAVNLGKQAFDKYVRGVKERKTPINA